MLRLCIFTGVPVDDSATFFRAGIVAKKLKEKKNKIYFASVSSFFKRRESKNINGLDVAFIGQAHYLAKGKFLFRKRLGLIRVLSENIKTCFRFCIFLKKNKPDKVLIVTTMPVALMAGLTAKILGFKTFVDIEDFTLGQMKASGYPFFLITLFGFVEKTCLNFFDKIIVPSSFLKEKYKGSILIANMVDISFWKQRKQKNEKVKRIVFVGQMGHYHGQESVLKAFAYSLLKNKNLKLIFVGGGEKLEELKMKSEKLKMGDRVIFTGQLPQERVQKILKTCDVGLLPLWDTPVHKARHPLKLIEYMAAGLVVVTNKVGESSKIIKNNINGILCPPEDINSLVKESLKIIKNPSLAKKIGQKAALSAQEFSIERVLPNWMEVLSS